MYHYMSPFMSLLLAATPSPAAQPSPSKAAGGLTLGSNVNPLFLVTAALAVLLLVIILVVRLGGRRRGARAESAGPPPAPATLDTTGLDPTPAGGAREIYQANPTPYIGVPPAGPAAAPAYTATPAPAPPPPAVAPAPLPPAPPAAPPTMPLAPPPLPQSSTPIDSPFAPEAPAAPPSTPDYPPAPLSTWAGAVPAEAPPLRTEPEPPPPPPPVAAPRPEPPVPPVAPVPLEIPPAPEPLPPRPEPPAAPVTPAALVTPFVDAAPPVAIPEAPAPVAPAAPAPEPEPEPEPEPDKPAAPEPPSAEAVAAASAAAAATTAPAPVPAGAPGSDKPPVILIIEDDERIQKFYSILFSAKGYKVESASDGVEGVDMATSLLPNLILLDVMMPKMNGLMVLQTLRANPDTEATPVVVLSNYMEPPLIQRALQLGAIEYVVKSQARPEQLVNAIPLWLEGKPALH